LSINLVEKETLSEANIAAIKKDLEEIENTFLTDEEYNNLKSEFSLLKNEITAQNEEVENLDSLFNINKEKLKSMMNKLNQIKSEQMNKLRDLESSIASLSSKINQNVQNYSNLQQEMNEKFIELKNYIKSWYADNHRVNTLQNVIKTLNDKVAEADMILKKNTADLETLQSQIDSLSENKNSINADEPMMQDLKLKISDIESSFQSLKETTQTEILSFQDLKETLKDEAFYDKIKERLLDYLQQTSNHYISTNDYIKQISTNINKIINNIKNEYFIIQLYSTKDLKNAENIILNNGISHYKFFKSFVE
jgi:DNA repair exonuclease SbcCD ATPase subunit